MDKVYLDIVRLTDNASFRIGYNSMWGILKDGLVGFGDVDNIVNFVDNSSRDGGFVTSTRLSSKTRSISAMYENPVNNEWNRKEAISFFTVKSKFRVYYTYGDRQVWAEGFIEKLKCNTSTVIKRGLRLDLQIIFPDPFWRSVDDFGEDIAAVKPMVAFPYVSLVEYVEGINPAGYTGAVFVFQPTVKLNNMGDTITYCRVIMTFKGDVVNPSFHVNGNYIKIIDNMVQGDTIDINMEAIPPTVKKNGVNWLGHCDKTSSFTGMELNKGENTISYTAEDGSDHMTVTVYYNERYEAI